MEWAQQHGFSKFDLGRCTPGGGTYEFKRHFGCEERALTGTTGLRLEALLRTCGLIIPNSDWRCKYGEGAAWSRKLHWAQDRVRHSLAKSLYERA